MDFNRTYCSSDEYRKEELIKHSYWTYYVNGTPTFTYHRVDSLAADGQYPFFRTQYLLIDMQLGGAWVGSVDPNDLPVEMEIDWVRNWVRTY